MDAATRTMVRPRDVTVAVSTEQDSSAALELAAAEALERQCGVRVVHVLPDAAPTVWTGDPVEQLQQLRSAGTDVLVEAARRLRERLGPAVPVRTELLTGPTVPALADCSRQSALMVLEHPLMGVPGRVTGMSVTTGVAAWSSAPVVAVPGTWRSAPRHPEAGSGPVLAVGLQDPVGSAEAVRWAVETAARRGGSVRLVHAWWFSDLYEQVHRRPAPWEESIGLEKALWAALEPVLEGLPAVPTSVVVSHDRPALALVAESADADLLVVCRRPPRPGARMLGPVARTVLREGGCPVVVVGSRSPLARPSGRVAVGALG